MWLLRKLSRRRVIMPLTLMGMCIYAMLLMWGQSCMRSSLSCFFYSRLPRSGAAEVAQGSAFEKVDWNDYALMEREAKRKGLGEQGKFAVLETSDKDKELEEALKKQYRYDAYIGDRISLERSIGDVRPEGCKKQLYLKNLPENSVSVIIPFYNERNTTLLRSIHSIVNRSPDKLLREVVIVDDCSSDEALHGPLEEYIQKHFTKVKLVRHTERRGLMVSRIAGADASTGQFLVFLDAHVEVNYNWLPPLIEMIVLDYKTIACPTVDFIGINNFNIITLAEKRCRGAFNWHMWYHRMPVPGIDQMDETEPHPSPLMVGCAFAISRQWWEEIGKYDPGLEVWGAEQYEISFKSWQCGGSVIDSPCSRVPHLFRDLPYVEEVNPRLDRNFLRVALVWMDEYKDIVLKRRPHMGEKDVGDISTQLELRKRLNCKSFKWYMENVAYDILDWFPIVEPPPMAWGKLRSNFNSTLCAFHEKRDWIEKLYLQDCKTDPGQTFEYDWRHHITEHGKLCLANPSDKRLEVWDCIYIEVKKVQLFAWDRHSGHIVNTVTGLCVDFNPASLTTFPNTCDDQRPTQSWSFEFLNATRVDEEWNKYKENRPDKHWATKL